MPTIESSRKKAVEEKLQAHRKSDTEYAVYNPVKNTAYSVMLSPGGTWYCTCPFATKGNHLQYGAECKHLRRVLDKLKGCGQGICREGKLCASCRFVDRMLE